METIKNKKILLVDDEKELLKLVKDALYKEGFYRVFTAETCAEARAVAEQQSPALCLLDVCLPDGDGFSLFEDIRRRADVPVIFLTARGEPDDKLQGLGLGADDYIVKPFLMKELVLRVTAVLKRIYGRVEEPAAAASSSGAGILTLKPRPCGRTGARSPLRRRSLSCSASCMRTKTKSSRATRSARRPGAMAITGMRIR